MDGFVGFRESFLGLVNHHMHWMLADYHPGQVAPDDTSPLLSLLLLLETLQQYNKDKRHRYSSTIELLKVNASMQYGAASTKQTQKEKYKGGHSWNKD